MHDPHALKALPFFSVRRAALWAVPNRFFRLYSRVARKPFDRCLDGYSCRFFSLDRGEPLGNTAVTSSQLDLLRAALVETETLGTPVVEVGCYFGATTRALALETAREIIAVDPYSGGADAEIAYTRFRNVVASLPNVRHLRQSSGDAARALAGQRFSLIFIDAVHDYMNSWFDFIAWNELLQDGGLMAFHDVDEWPGTNVACQRILRGRWACEPWAYCPNLVIFSKTNRMTR